MEIKLDPCLADGLHTAFEGGILDGVGVIGDDFEKPEDNRNDYH